MRDSCNIARDIMLTRVHKELCHIPMNIKNIYERNGMCDMDDFSIQME